MGFLKKLWEHPSSKIFLAGMLVASLLHGLVRFFTEREEQAPLVLRTPMPAPIASPTLESAPRVSQEERVSSAKPAEAPVDPKFRPVKNDPKNLQPPTVPVGGLDPAKANDPVEIYLDDLRTLERSIDKPETTPRERELMREVMRKKMDEFQERLEKLSPEERARALEAEKHARGTGRL